MHRGNFLQTYTTQFILSNPKWWIHGKFNQFGAFLFLWIYSIFYEYVIITSIRWIIRSRDVRGAIFKDWGGVRSISTTV